MRRPAYQKVQRGGAVAAAYHVPAPTGGLNKRDSISEMDEKDALIMDNMFPESNDVRVRRGYNNHVTGLAANAESFMPYNNPDGTQELYCAEGTDFFDVTAAGAVGAAVQSTLTNARWQSVNFTNSSADSYLCCFNGTDAPRYWDGTSWTTITGASTPAITGLTTTTIVNAFIHKRRLWLIQNSSLNAWYLPVDSVGGAAKALDLGGIATQGGHIVSGGTWTVDGGDGIDDYLVLITSEGQLVAYKGTDPSSASTWAMVGMWDIGEPIGRRCFKSFKGDLLCITVEGVESIAKIISGQSGDSTKITDKISGDYVRYAEFYSANFGWELCYYPKGDMLILNIPVEENSYTLQYAMNTNTGSWGGPWKELNADCWVIFEEEPFFGTFENVRQFWSQDSDAGTNIFFDTQQAFSSLGSPGLIKKVSAVRPLIKSTAPFNIQMKVNADYIIQLPQGAVSGPGSNLLTFGSSVVGDGAIWGTSLALDRDWELATAVGTVAGIRMKGSVNDSELRYQACDMSLEVGGLIG